MTNPFEPNHFCRGYNIHVLIQDVQFINAPNSPFVFFDDVKYGPQIFSLKDMKSIKYTFEKITMHVCSRQHINTYRIPRHKQLYVYIIYCQTFWCSEHYPYILEGPSKIIVPRTSICTENCPSVSQLYQANADIVAQFIQPSLHFTSLLSPFSRCRVQNTV
jgi:hypothetical protein